MIFPSIDLMGGKVVQLERGEIRRFEAEDPLERAEIYARHGVLHVIDLDAAFSQGVGGRRNEEIARELCRRHACNIGGGVRTVEEAVRRLRFGASKVILGSALFKDGGLDRTFLAALARRVPREHLIFALDARHGEVVVDAWRRRTGLRVEDVIGELEPYCSEFVVTAVEREGMMEGTDMAAIERLVHRTANPVHAAGGIASIAEILALAALGAGAVLGMAIYTGRLDLTEAFLALVDFSSGGLVPTIVQDLRGQVLMLAYSNPQSLARALRTGEGWYWSRSRAALWRKGETSGHVQQLAAVRFDCDRDALLFSVKQTGVACHRGSYSCFGERSYALADLVEVIGSRRVAPAESSYTARLLADPELLAAKIREEAQEMLEAAGRDDLIWEAADLAYHTLVLLARHGVAPGEVVAELRGRRKPSG